MKKPAFTNRPPNPAKKPGHRPGPPPKDVREKQREQAIEALAGLDDKMPGLGARRAALDLLMLLRRGRTLDQALTDCRSFDALAGPDRAFAHNLVSTTMRHRGSLDEVIGHYLDRPLPPKSMEVQDILRLAACQLLILETPAHAAVATAVELAAQKRETSGYKGLVNALTRKISDKGPALLKKLPLRSDTPGWLWRSWERAYGAAHARDIARAHQMLAPLDISLKPGTDPSLFDLIEGSISLAPNHIRLPGQHTVPDLPGFDDGAWWVQDLAASLPARLLGDISGKTVFDLCAAPGGKTLQLAAAGADVFAVDASGQRLKRVSENLKRTNLSAKTVKADILDWAPETAADAILLDAPCSATGTIRRNPDVSWTRTHDDVRALARLQSEFIDRAVTFLKPGGVLVYCTCSLQREEGEDQLKAALARHDNLAHVPVSEEEAGDLPGPVVRNGCLRTLPSMLAEHGGMDGFFAFRVRNS